MKPLKLIALVALAFTFSHCKAPTQVTQGAAPSLIQSYSVLDTTVSTLYQFGSQNGGNGQLAMMQTAAWLKTQPTIQSVTVIDSTWMNIQLKSGLITSLYLDQIDADSISLFRGGGGSNPSRPVVLKRTGTLSSRQITNKDALFWLPVEFEFYKDPSQVLYFYDLLQNSPVPVKYHSATNGDCTPQSVADFRNYGLVIMDTHGCPDAFLAGNKIVFTSKPATDDEVKTVTINNVGQDTYDKLLTGEIRLAFGVRINNIAEEWQKKAPNANVLTLRLLVTTKYIDELPDMPNTIVFGNMCYSGATVNHEGFGQPMANSWQRRSLISYYGFTTTDGVSAPVQNGFSKVVLESFLNRLAINTDSTGVAHLATDGSEFIDPDTKDSEHPLSFSHFGDDDYSYSLCGQPFTDARDGQIYNTVCIGDQTWMAQNLNYNAPGSLCYENDPGNCNKYGRLYDWKTVMQGATASNASPSGVQGVCPKGWHVPSDAEFSHLLDLLGGPTAADQKLRASGASTVGNWIGGTNSSGFTALPAGWFYSGKDSVSFYQLHNWALFHTTSMNTALNQPLSFGLQDGVYGVIREGDYGGESCRCLKDPK